MGGAELGLVLDSFELWAHLLDAPLVACGDSCLGDVGLMKEPFGTGVKDEKTKALEDRVRDLEAELFRMRIEIGMLKREVD